ncbi:MAG: hypothetical protein ACOY0T_13590 [Myxococcota bacterium]
MRHESNIPEGARAAEAFVPNCVSRVDFRDGARNFARLRPKNNAATTMRRKFKPAKPSQAEDVLLRRAQRLSRQGDDRKAMLAAREACFASPQDARLWALYGALCFRARRREEALHAFGQSLWIRQRAKDERRVKVVRKLIEQVELGADELRAA